MVIRSKDCIKVDCEMTGILLRILVAIGISLGISLRGYKRKSLSLSGSMAAFTLGLLTFASGIGFGVVLIFFYLAGSYATKVGFWCVYGG
jgi:uncharacterized membrane protein